MILGYIGLYKENLEENGTDIQYPKPGGIYEIDGLILSVLFPDNSFSVHVHNINNASIVVRIDHDENSFLFTGDAERKAENIYSKLGSYLAVDVVKIGHHGSKACSSLKIVENSNASYGVISLGKLNKHRHPSELIIERWRKSGTQLFRTDESGAIMMISNGESLHISKMIE